MTQPDLTPVSPHRAPFRCRLERELVAAGNASARAEPGPGIPQPRGPVSPSQPT